MTATISTAAAETGCDLKSSGLRKCASWPRERDLANTVVAGIGAIKTILKPVHIDWWRLGLAWVWLSRQRLASDARDSRPSRLIE